MLIGLTGGIASGKSTVSNILKSLGVSVIDADLIAKEIVEPGKAAWQKIVDYFGKEILLPNQNLNRQKLGDIIFNNQAAREKLNQITHPYVISEIEARVKKLREEGEEVIVVDVPLLIESNMVDIFDEIWVVYVSRKTQIQRLMERDQIDYEDAIAKIEAQLSLDKKKEYADRLIINEGSKDELKDKVLSIWRDIDDKEETSFNCSR
ncbi:MULTISPECIES: dephospho-CoA kinase [unclassified Candidatus Frackibacter]|uniref:dephospho-CoA kinase n=1 Tax=unclassified Candidatus Frackibacter TaxID=2648818 RepID=UPI00089152C5|nr:MULTISPECIES: dephospho-CoA kinase [unclassified Candidatus Frackibacter]SDC30460.1 dephospho-CoA kinase [Candidatus Frackibacter sp. WG11]SEM74258.1 dephospho-CoA kinase [Candidatus Frackibacter sp. WG12]SFL58300.1 dephospho-CoA kinase [Candidatus Frackibacter sp. WG13]